MKAYGINLEWRKKIDELISQGKLNEFNVTSKEFTEKLKEAYSKLAKYVDSDPSGKPDGSGNAMGNIIAYLNYKCGERELVKPSERYYVYWIKINGLYFYFQLLNGYVGGGVEENKIDILALDSEGSEEFWTEVIEELLIAAKGEMENKDGFKYRDWAYFWNEFKGDVDWYK